MTKKQMEKLSEKVFFSFWGKYTVIRFATSWSTRKEDVETLCQVIEEL